MKAQIGSIVLGCGCFWCTEAVFDRIRGIESVQSGYSSPCKSQASYPDIKRAITNLEGDFAEVIKIQYNQDKISLRGNFQNIPEILSLFFNMHDPCKVPENKKARQYRSAIFYQDSDQLPHINQAIGQYEEKQKKKVITQLSQLVRFIKAEEKHQKYYDKNRTSPYCANNIDPIIKQTLQSMKK